MVGRADEGTDVKGASTGVAISSLLDDLSGKLDERTALGNRVKALLEADSRVLYVTIAGSQGNGAADVYSDVDLSVVVSPDVKNRAFAQDVPLLVAPVGSLLIEGWALRVLPDRYSRTLYFVDYPLFWHVDVGCRGGEHTDGSDILADYHATRFFKTWLETLKGLLRGKADEDPAFPERMLSRWLRLPETGGGDEKGLILVEGSSLRAAGERLAIYLEACRDAAVEEWRTAREQSKFQARYDFDVERRRIDILYARCDELRRVAVGQGKETPPRRT